MFKNLLKHCCTVFLILGIALKLSVSFANTEQFVGGVAVVDVQSILEHSIAVQNIRKSIDSISNDIQQEVTKEETKLKSLEEKLKEIRSSLSETAFEKEVEAFNKKVSAVQTDIHNKKSRLEHAHSQAIRKVHDTTISIIADLAKKHGFNIVLPSSQVLFITDELNLTQKVVQLLNDKLKTVEISY